MLKIKAALWDTSIIEVTADTPRATFAEAFKKVGCKTLNQWETLIREAYLIGEKKTFSSFKKEDHPLPDEELC